MPSTTKRRDLSLCARVVPEVSASEVIDIAVNAGYDAVGFAFDDPADLDMARARELGKQVNDSPLYALDIDVIRIQPGPANPGHLRFIDCAAEIGVRHILAVSQDPNIERTTEKFADLCQHAAGAGLGIVFEFLMITDYKTLDDAFAVVNGAGQPNGKILIDTLHLARAGHAARDITRFDASMFPYLQLSDGPAEVDLDNFDALVFDAREGRLPPGEGELPLGAMLRVVDHRLPISIEVRSTEYNRRFPDAAERAQRIGAATRGFLESLAL